MNTLLIVWGLLTLYCLTGYLPRRPILPDNAHWHSFGFGKKTWFFIDGDKWYLFGRFPRPWGFTKPLFMMSYRIVFDAETKADALAEIEKFPKTNSSNQKVTYSQPVQLPGVGKMHKWVVTATEMTNNTRKRSVQGALVDIHFPDAGLDFNGLLGAVVMIDEPKKMLDIEGGLAAYVQNETKDAVSAHFTESEAVWKKAWDKTKKELSFAVYLIREMEKFRIDDPKNKMRIPGTKTDWKTYLNKEKFQQFGVSYKEPSWVLGYGEDALALKKERTQQQLNDEKEKTKVTEEKMMEKQRIIWVNNSVAKGTVIENTAGKVANIAVKFYAGKGEQFAKIQNLKVLMVGGDEDPISKQFANILTALEAQKEVTNEN